MKMKSPQLKSPTALLCAAGRKVMMLLVASIMLAGFSSFSFPAGDLSSNSKSTSLQADPQPGWVLYASVRNVDFYYRIGECTGKKVVFLRFNNRNTQKVKVSWKEVFNTQFEVQKEGFRGTKHLMLPVGETAQSDCSNLKVKELVVLPSHVNPSYNAEIKKFHFKSINVVNL
jgi:hypothetical protein